jgi:hypothetical protein
MQRGEGPGGGGCVLVMREERHFLVLDQRLGVTEATKTPLLVRPVEEKIYLG